MYLRAICYKPERIYGEKVKSLEAAIRVAQGLLGWNVITVHQDEMTNFPLYTITVGAVSVDGNILHVCDTKCPVQVVFPPIDK